MTAVAVMPIDCGFDDDDDGGRPSHQVVSSPVDPLVWRCKIVFRL